VNGTVRLRLVRPDDAAAIAAIYAPIVEHTTISFEEVAPNEAAMRERIVAHPPNRPWLVAESDGTVAGYASGGDFRVRLAYRWSTEVTVYVAEAVRGRGIGRMLYDALFRILTVQGYRRAFAGITLPNAASVALHRRCGFVECGVFHAAGFKLGSWCDVAIFERALRPTTAPPVSSPLALADLDPAVLEAALGAR
jgi:L-amino acid N-acyltransferase YncA